MIYKNGKNVTAIYKGTTPIIKVYKGLKLVWEAFKTIVLSGIPPLTFFSTGEPLIDYKIDGNSIQASDPTPTAPVEVESVGDSTINLLNPDISSTLYGTYRYRAISDTPQELTISIKDKDTTVDISNVSFGFTANGLNASGGYGWIVSNGNARGSSWLNTVTTTGQTLTSPMMFFSVYPTTPSTWEKIFKRFYIQIEKGNIATEYEPFGYKIPVVVNNATTSIYLGTQLSKLGNYFDNVSYLNNKLTKRIAVKTFDGTENWEVHNENANNVVYKLDNVLTPLMGASVNSTYMTHFELTNIYSTDDFIAGLYRFGFNQDNLTITSTRLYVSSDKITLAGFKTWLSENKPTIYYPDAVVTEETIDLPEILTGKNTNIISVNTTIQPSNMEVTYKGK